jgi:hypothetical protein
MQALVGYKLIEIETGNVIETWGGKWGVEPPIPNPIRLPNGDHVHAPSVDVDYGGYKLTWLMMDEPVIIPDSITRRQCALQLLTLNMITPAEAVEMVQAGIPPEIVKGYIDALPSEMDRAVATINFAAATYQRLNPLLFALMQANGKTEADRDQFFIAAAQL